MAAGNSAGVIVPARAATLAMTAVIVTYYIGRFRDCVLVFFGLDDFWVLNDAARVQIRGFTDIAAVFVPGHNGFLLYRPLTTVGYFYVMRQLFGYDASGYHAAQLLGHIANALLACGILRLLTGSVLAATAGGVIYAAAPGHIGAVYPLCNFTMTGTALVVLSMLYLWLRLGAATRVVACTLLQGVGVLASEHAVIAPLLLATLSLLRRPREPLLKELRQVAAPAAVAAGYVAVKVYYLVVVRQFVPGESYAPSFSVWGWLLSVGRYAVASLNLLALLPLSEWMLVLGGTMLLVTTGVACWQASLGRRGWNLVALGLTVFVMSLLPVLPLSAHFFAHYIGIAAMGIALAIVGGCQCVSRRWRGLAAVLAAAIVLVEVLASGRATRTDPVYLLYRGAADASARWVETVRRAHVGPDRVDEVWVPREGLTVFVFGFGPTQQLFDAKAVAVNLYDPLQPPPSLPGRTVLREPIEALGPGGLPGWQRHWNWLRWAARFGRRS